MTISFIFPATGAYAQESARDWYNAGKKAVERAKRLKPVGSHAKNVILFIGDGMGITTVTASRILEGQRRGESGEENLLSFETFPFTALVKTYTVDMQTPDSAGTMTAIATGIKSRGWMMSLDPNETFENPVTARNLELTTILDLAERAGLATGIVTTARVTHATPAALYAHSPSRFWEDDTWLTERAKTAAYPDVARQLIDYAEGNGIEVVLGGGRASFLPETVADPEYPQQTGLRKDGRNLIKKWSSRPHTSFVWNRAGFDALIPGKVGPVLGLFEPSHMQFEHDRDTSAHGEPSLAEMTAKAVAILSRNKNGFFLMVEGGRIDHAHHLNNAFRALDETVALSDAVRTATKKTDRRETLIIVTADHSHVLTMGGYAGRGNPILGLVGAKGEATNPLWKQYNRTLDAKRFTALAYGNGIGGAHENQPSPLNEAAATNPDYRQISAAPKVIETHGGQDVAVYADGPDAQLFHGVIEQNVLFHVMVDALGLPGGAPDARTLSN